MSERTRAATGVCALWLALWLTHGCAVTPGSIAECDECADVEEAVGPCAGPECAACLDEEERPLEAAFVRRADELVVLADALEASLIERCDVMVAQMALRDAPVGLDACPVIAEEVDRRVTQLFPVGVRPGIANEPALCFAPMDVAERCLERCGEAGPVRCEGEMLGACPETCDGVCHGFCNTNCQGTCSDFCDGGCDGACVGVCEGECTTFDRDGRCIVRCDGHCSHGVCDGTCSGTCSGVCTETCNSTCDGTCIGGCDGAWTPSCQGVVVSDAPTCALVCTAEAGIAAECPIPEVRVRGPEAEDPRDHGLIDQLILTVSRHYEPLYALEARVRVTLEPWLDALDAALSQAALADPESCLTERADAVRDAIRRLRSYAETARLVITAAEEAVGERLD